MTRQREPLQTSALDVLGKAAVAYQNSPRLQASYPSKARYLCEKVGHLFHNGSDTGICTWKSRLERARKILHGKKILKGKSGRRALPTSAWKALGKAAVVYQGSPRLQTSYASKAQYYNEKVGHLFRKGSNWKNRLYHARKILRDRPIFTGKKTRKDVLHPQFCNRKMHTIS